MRTATTLAAAFSMLASAPAQGGSVLAVGPGQAHATIQGAVDAAVDGDVIEVAPGSYAAFSIVNKRLSVVAVDPTSAGPATFTVVAVPNAPGILVEGLVGGRRVTLAGARLAHASPTHPAVLVRNNPGGDVRLQDVAVTTAANLGVVPYAGLLEVRNTASASLDRVSAGDHRVFGNGDAGAAGLAGLFSEATSLHLNRCRFSGLRSTLAAVAGGDGLRIDGSQTSWIVDSTLVGGFSAAGAVPGTLGGHPLHDSGGHSGPILVCDSTLMPTVSTVSWFAVATVPSFLAACLGDSIGRTTLSPFATSLQIGTTTAFTVEADVYNRAFLTVFSTEFSFGEIPGLVVGATLIGGHVAVLLVGSLNGPQTIPLTIPAVPAAIGLQATVQSALLDPYGASTWAMSTAAGFTVR